MRRAVILVVILLSRLLLGYTIPPGASGGRTEEVILALRPQPDLVLRAID